MKTYAMLARMSSTERSAVDTAKPGRRAQARLRSRAKILNVAEKYFATLGYSGASLRRIAAEANVQLALIYYYFGSKAQLYEEVLQRHVATLNASRIEVLDRLRAQNAPVDPVLADLVAPLIDYGLNGAPTTRRFTLLLARIFFSTDEESVELVKKHFDPLATRFIDELGRVFPDLDRRTRAWLYTFAIGTAIGSLASEKRVTRLSAGARQLSPAEIERMAVTFVVGGAKAVARAQSKQGAEET